MKVKVGLDLEAGAEVEAEMAANLRQDLSKPRRRLKVSDDIGRENKQAWVTDAMSGAEMRVDRAVGERLKRSWAMGWKKKCWSVDRIRNWRMRGTG